MRILITGGTGFIGSRLALKCLKDGHQVRVLGMENTEAEAANRHLIEAAGAEMYFASVIEKEKLAEALEGVDVVFHLAAAQHEAGVPDQHFRDINVTGTQNMLEASVHAGVKRFVHGSTIGVYGDTEKPVVEESYCNPSNIYGLTKLAAEKIVLSYKTKLPVVIIRISETYGPGDRRLLKLFKAIAKKHFFIIGNGRNLHQLIYVEDLIAGMIKASQSELASGEILLLVGKTPLTTQQMVETISGVLEVPMWKIHAPLWPFMMLAVTMEYGLKPFGIQPPLHRRRMDFFRKNFSFKTNKAEKMLDFTPSYSFKRGVAETADWYRELGELKTNSHAAGQDERSQNLIIDPNLTAKIEPFDTFWEAPEDVEKGFEKFDKFYQRNYFKYLPEKRDMKILVISCGAGYMLNTLKKNGYANTIGIDSDPDKIAVAQNHMLNGEAVNAFAFLENSSQRFDLVFAEQEINHLTKEEIKSFLKLCHENLTDNGKLVVHSLNGANPITGSEALAQNIDHYNTLTEYSLKQLLQAAGFVNTKVFPLKLYIFYENPINYIGMALNALMEILFRAAFIFYGKDNKIFSKKIAAVCEKRTESPDV